MLRRNTPDIAVMVVMLLFMVGVAGGITAAPALSDGIPDNCEYADGAYYQTALFPRYEANNRRLVLVDWTTGDDVLTLATDLDRPEIRGWTGDCRYLVGHLRGKDTSRILFWDTLTGAQAYEFNHPGNGRFYLAAVRPNNPDIIIQINRQYHLIDATARTSLVLPFAPRYMGDYYLRLYAFWDDLHNWLFASDANTVYILNPETGIEITRFETPGSPMENECQYYYDPCRFSFNHDKSVLFTGSSRSGLGIWNLSNFSGVTVDVDPPGTTYLDENVALSPDNRYVVMARVGTVRIWDLNTLPQELDQRDPIFRILIPPGRIVGINFLDNITTDLVTRAGNRFHLNVTTGEITPVE